MKCRASLGFSSLFLCVLASTLVVAGEDARMPEAELPVVKLSPKVRNASRDRDWFQHLPCTDLGRVTPVTDEEARWLADRRQACVRQYQDFGGSGMY